MRARGLEADAHALTEDQPDNGAEHFLVCGGWVEQLAGSALVSGDPRRAVVRATLAAVNRRLAALLP